MTNVKAKISNECQGLNEITFCIRVLIFVIVMIVPETGLLKKI